MHTKSGCADARFPKSNQSYWSPKLIANTERDKRHLQNLKVLGWRTLVIWECEIKQLDLLRRRIVKFLGE